MTFQDRNEWYEFHFFDFNMIWHLIQHNFAKSYWGEGGCGCVTHAKWILMLKMRFYWKIWLLVMISHTWEPPIRPPILYHLKIKIWRSYLLNTKKIIFISFVLAFNRFVERNTKNHWFLVFRQNFRILDSSSRSSKMQKIACRCPWKLRNMTNGRKDMVFDCG